MISAIAFDRPTHFTQPSGMGRQLRVRCVRVSKERGERVGVNCTYSIVLYITYSTYIYVCKHVLIAVVSWLLVVGCW